MLSTHPGFTIVEMVITTAITSIVFIIVSAFVIDGLHVQKYASDQNEAVTQTRKALAVMTSELREMVASDAGAYPIELASTQEIIFYGDVDKDTYTERVRYVLQNSTLYRGKTEPEGDPVKYETKNEELAVLSEYVRNNANDPLFYYYSETYPQDVTNNPLSTPIDRDLVRMVQIHVLTNVDPEHIPDTHTLDAFVHLRNLKENF